MKNYRGKVEKTFQDFRDYDKLAVEKATLMQLANDTGCAQEARRLGLKVPTS
jgi:hypothetical protein